MRWRLKRYYQPDEWHPYFFWWPRKVHFKAFANNDEPHPYVSMWVWLEPGERIISNHDHFYIGPFRRRCRYYRFPEDTPPELTNAPPELTK